MEKATIRGAELEYEVTGSGEPVLLVSTGPIADSFLPLASQKALSSYSLIRYRQRRAGRAGTADMASVSFAEHAADAAALLAHLKIAQAHVAGHSTGAAIALQLALDHPQKVATLTLLEPPLLSAPSAGAFFESAGPALAAYAAGEPESAVTKFLSMVCSLEWSTCRTEIDRHIPGGSARAIAEADNFFGSYLPALGAWQFGADQASGIGQPVLSLLGTESEQLFADSHALLHDWFPQVQDCVVQAVAHLLHLQRPEPVATCVAAFLRRHPIRTTADAPVLVEG